MTSKLLKGNTLDLMREMRAQTVDLVITAPIYGSPTDPNAPLLPLETMWSQLRRIVKTHGAICLFGQEPFSSQLRASAPGMFQYDWIWEKSYPGNFVAASYQPLRFHEIISVFSPGRAQYFPIKESRLTVGLKRIKGSFGEAPALKYALANMNFTDSGRHPEQMRNPSSIQFFNNRTVGGKKLYPYQKPAELIEYLIKTHSRVGDTVLDFNARTGDVGMICAKLERNFIGLETDEKWYKLAKERINNALLD